jgi:hypothetical protein
MTDASGDIVVSVDHEDIRHLVASGTTQIATTDSDITVHVKCTEGIKFDVHLADEEGDG